MINCLKYAQSIDHFYGFDQSGVWSLITDQLTLVDRPVIVAALLHEAPNFRVFQHILRRSATLAGAVPVAGNDFLRKWSEIKDQGREIKIEIIYKS